MTKAPLTIRVDAKTRRYGEPSPTYTARFDGLVNGDTKEVITGLFFRGAPADASVGDYFDQSLRRDQPQLHHQLRQAPSRP